MLDTNRRVLFEIGLIPNSRRGLHSTKSCWTFLVVVVVARNLVHRLFADNVGTIDRWPIDYWYLRCLHLKPGSAFVRAVLSISHIYYYYSFAQINHPLLPCPPPPAAPPIRVFSRVSSRERMRNGRKTHAIVWSNFVIANSTSGSMMWNRRTRSVHADPSVRVLSDKTVNVLIRGISRCF